MTVQLDSFTIKDFESRYGVARSNIYNRINGLKEKGYQKPMVGARIPPSWKLQIQTLCQEAAIPNSKFLEAGTLDLSFTSSLLEEP